MERPGKAYAILCAKNNIRLGIRRSYFMEWAAASGYTQSTAATYWNIAKNQSNKNQ